ncbi:MAG TPA: HYR domain-containing protein, partial [Blastocatellia bacterium]|nr:HYR domain-containing protein [Blastocatellia bacterium]
ADDCTFWYTQQYYTAASQASSSVGWLTRIMSFKYPSCVAPPKGALMGAVTDCSTGLPLEGAVVEILSNGFLRQADMMGNYSGNLPPGTFDVQARFFGYLPATGTAVITDGNTTVLNLCLMPTAVIEPAGGTITAENCSPANGAIDPGEMVTVSLCVQNTGAADTVDLVGTLQATGGVTNPSGPQSYGVVTAGGPAICREFTFTASAMCGDMITATLQLQDGTTDLGTVTFTFQVGTLNIVLTENFDGVTAPALPAGWTATTLLDDDNVSDPWATTTVTPDTAPNAVFTNDPGDISDEVLDTPAIPITSTSAQLSFRNNFNLEDTFDGGVLEISIGGGPFQDIIDAGGSFVTGGYTDVIDDGFGSPIAGRMAWSGNSGGYIDTVVNLPAAAAGQNIVLRFRRATDSSVSAQFWRIDTVKVSDGFVCCQFCTMIICPSDITVSNDPDLCGAVVNYPAPTADPGCGTVTCSPPAGSFFPIGTTMVTCTSAVGPSCSFNVTVNDTQPPTITCPANVTAVAPLTCPPAAATTVSFPDPTASDNCPGVTVACVPPSGSMLPVGTTTVTCTATDAAGNTASCSFSVSVFDICLQDDSNSSVSLLINSLTGAYQFTCGGTTFTGTGKITGLGCGRTLNHNAPDRRVRASWDTSVRRGNASLQLPPGTTRCTIVDSNMANNSCVASAPPPPPAKSK